MEQVARVIDRGVKELFPAGAVLRAELRRRDDDPGRLAVRVVIPAAEDLAAWADLHQQQMEELRRQLSLHLPSARTLEFTADAADAPVISMPDDGSLAAGEYDNMDEITLTEVLTSHLQEASGDKHLRVRLGGGPGPGREPARGPGSPDRDRTDRDTGARAGHEERRLRMRQRGRLDNFGIHRVERLDGNIGYLDVRRVPLPENAGPAIAAAMELVAGTYALIIDLRRNGGGSPEGVAFWCSYLLPEQPTHLNDIFHAGTGETRQFWSLPYLPGGRYLDRPVYVLTSGGTFSGGEDFCYTLQALRRAELVGEVTGGGAHPTRPFPISPAVHIGIPFARSVSPVTGTNWQGTGVVPDMPAAAGEAYDVAYARALRHVLDLGGVPPPIADEARAALAALG